MQTTTQTPRKGGPGRPVGHLMPLTVKKIAIRTLQDIMLDASAPAEARVMAACKLVDHER